MKKDLITNEDEFKILINYLKQKYTYQFIANILNKSRRTIMRYYNGERKIPKRSYIQINMCIFMHCSKDFRYKIYRYRIKTFFKKRIIK